MARASSPSRLAALPLAALLALSHGGCGGSAGCSAPKADAVKPAPEFALKDLSGKTVRLADFRGKIVLIDFWATWCDPCRESIPFYETLQQKRRSERFTVLGIAEDAMTEVVAPFVKENKMTYPILLDPDTEAYEAFGVLGLPTSYLVDAEGNIRRKWIGFDEADVPEIERTLDLLLSEKPSAVKR